jgi:penicillin-binding protein 1A
LNQLESESNMKNNKKKAEPEKKKSPIRKWLRFLWLGFTAGVFLVIILFFAISSGWLGFMPTFEELENPKSNLASEIYSADQVLLGKYFIENRSNASYDELSPNLVHALIATEDARFYEHSGVDLKALVRAVAKLGKDGGGSTVTQQLAKNLFPREDLNTIETIFRKMKEWVIAVKLEYNYTKEEILAMYLNTVTFGHNSFGIKTASKTYFNKAPGELNLEEAAVLVGMLKAPSYYNPVRNNERSQHRRNVVLNQMEKYGYIDEASCDSVKALPLDISHFMRQDHNQGYATYFREYLRSEMKEWCATHYKPDGEPYNLYKDGLKIYTTINSKMQQYAEEAVYEHLAKDLQPTFFDHWSNKKRFPNAPFYRLNAKQREQIMTQAMKRSDRYYWLKKKDISMDSIKKNFNTPVEMTVFSWNGPIDTLLSPMDSILYYKYFLQTGMMAIEPQTGYVRAYVGGINYRYFKYDHVTAARRQVGSTFKPFVYASAFQELGFSPCTEAPNIPVTFDMPPGQPDYTPKNSDAKREGEMVSLKWALANSVNYISAYLMKRVKPGKVIELARKMGVKSEIEPVPAICLGTPSLSVEEMVGATATYANKGIYNKPVYITRIEDKNGNVIESFQPIFNEAMNEKTAYLMISLMKGVVEFGTGIRLRYRYKYNNPIAGKTGTTDNNSDGWFMGLTPDLVTGVWVGAEDRSVHFRSTYYGQGANMALPIWALFMKKVYEDKDLDLYKGDFEKPENLDVELDCAKYKKQQSQRMPSDFDN